MSLEHSERIDVAITTNFRTPVKIALSHVRILLLGRGKLTDALPALHGLANAEGRSCWLEGGMDSRTSRPASIPEKTTVPLHGERSEGSSLPMLIHIPREPESHGLSGGAKP